MKHLRAIAGSLVYIFANIHLTLRAAFFNELDTYCEACELFKKG